jgi:predicted TIM-barrel fold metal-dependent hydrolase
MHPYFPQRPAWLAATQEEAIDPALQIVDAHHHLWTKPGEPYQVTDYHGDVNTGHNIVATVFVECKTHYRKTGDESLRPLGEIEYVIGQAGARALHQDRRVDIAAGVIGYADLMLGAEVAEVLAGEIALGAGRMRGIRNISVWHPDPSARASALEPLPGLLLHPKFHEGFAQLAPLGLSFDAWLTHTQLGDLRDLADRFPDTTIVLDHCGGPLGVGPYANRRRHVFGEWRSGLEQLSCYENVQIKIGGLGMRWTGLGLDELSKAPTSTHLAESWTPYVETCVELFGPERCMFESNFPVDKGLCSYTVLWNAFKRITAGWSEHERRDLFCGTASRIYRLNGVVSDSGPRAA